MTLTTNHSELIAALNDRLRQGDTSLGQIQMTQAVSSLPDSQRQQLLQAVREFKDFTPDNDPYQEHDFLSIEWEGTIYFFKVDYFDKAAWQKGEELGASSPEDSQSTWRVATLMESSEY